jgi:hypothetical protein
MGILPEGYWKVDKGSARSTDLYGLEHSLAASNLTSVFKKPAILLAAIDCSPAPVSIFRNGPPDLPIPPN